MKEFGKIFLIVIALGFAPGAVAASARVVAAGLCVASVAADGGQTVVLPRPPAELRTVPSRAGWLVEHYWDLTDLNNISSRDVEQAFVNYLSLFPLVQSDSLCRAAVAHLVEKADAASAQKGVEAAGAAGVASGAAGVAGVATGAASADGAAGAKSAESSAVNAAGSRAVEYFIELAEKYLYDLDSPLASEEQYLWFIDAGLHAANLPAIRKEILLAQKRVIQNNPVGSQISDFYFETATGSGLYFHQLLAHNDMGVQNEILLLFFEIGCPNCEAMIDRLKAEYSDTKTVAIALNANATTFRAYAPTLPAGWTVGYDSTGAINGTIFAIRHLPDLYRLTPTGTILTKHFLPTR